MSLWHHAPQFALVFLAGILLVLVLGLARARLAWWWADRRRARRVSARLRRGSIIQEFGGDLYQVQDPLGPTHDSVFVVPLSRGQVRALSTRYIDCNFSDSDWKV